MKYHALSLQSQIKNMPRKTKDELRIGRRDKSLTDLIARIKFLRDTKFYKNNYWSWAAWDSWAAQGKAGGCSCCHNDYYNGSLRNKRAHTKRGGRNEKWAVDVSPNLCYDCVTEIHKKINTEFQKN